ncbi:unnamed protein product [Chironomus riparius]|uniref:Ubiquitin-like protein 7 n=1 Tax=Chironomus riparius TaxID=315576 RepID=A0A9N9WVB5_9DIPT|nr:unnamed protein product [Chironomus riparius]
MEYVFCGIKFAEPRNYEKIRVDINFNENSVTLKEKIQKDILKTKDEISLIFCGNELNDDEPINKYNLRTGSTVQVLRRIIEIPPKEFTTKFTEMDVSRVSSLFRGLNSGNFHKISRPEVIQQIYKKHPELQRDIIAMSFLKDPILLSTLQNPDTVRNMAENHRMLVEAAETICKALRSVKATAAEPQMPIRRSFEDLSDSSSSSGSENLPRASTSNAANIRITTDFLRQSLEQARQNQNSLENISQRNLSQSSSISPSSSSSSVPNRRNIISNSMVMSAIDEVLRARRSETDILAREPSVSSTASSNVESQPTEVAQEQIEEPEIERMEDEDNSERDARDIEMITSFQTQLRQMEDMGLSNKAANIQALMVCNGNLEAAVNLVLAEMNMS